VTTTALPDLTEDSAGLQRALVALLVRPLVTRSSDPELHQLLRRHVPRLGDLSRRLGYRLVQVGGAIRLVRVPLGGRVEAPPPPADAPPRRVLALVCLLAAACEETTAVATLAQLSAGVTALARPGEGASGYDQGQGADRRLLKRAAEVLAHWGVLVPQAWSEDQLDRWTSLGAGVGQVFEVDRDALLLLTSPDHAVRGLTDGGDVDEERMSTRGVRALRRLVEQPAVLYADLEPDDAASLRATRGLRASEAAQLTGGHVEARSEGLVLLLPEEPPSPAVVAWPRAETVSWVALLALHAASQLARPDPDGVVDVPPDRVERLRTEVLEQHGPAMAKELRNHPVRLWTLVEHQLVSLALLRVGPDGSWRVSPVAGRYRDPQVGAGE
jgi:uncharacterized protein (TIGR02678 family)